MRRLTIPAAVATDVQAIVDTAAPAEGGCFCLLHRGQGARGVRLLVGDVIVAGPGDWDRQGRDMLTPSARWISKAVTIANAKDCGLLFVHSHPDPRHRAAFSEADRAALAGLGRVMATIIDGPFVAAIVHADGWIAAEVDSAGALHPVDRVQSLDRTLVSLDPAGPPEPGQQDGIDARQADALGSAHSTMRKLHVGIIGAGGLGSPLAEAVVRMGAAEITLLDPDRLDTPSNLRRVFGSTVGDLAGPASPFKVDVVGRHVEAIGLGVTIRRLPWDVRTERAVRELIDCDVIMCTTDTHSSRAVVVDLAYAYGIPVIDAGVRVGARAGALAGLAAEVRVLTPATPCLWCRGAISPDAIREELLPAEQREQLRREGYLVGAHGDAEPSVGALTMLGAGLMTCALLSLISPDGQDAPSSYVIDGFFGDAIPNGAPVKNTSCWCQAIARQGDNASLTFLPEPT